jgi:hypothetical protein
MDQKAAEIVIEKGITIINVKRLLSESETITLQNELAANYPYKLRLWNFSDVSHDKNIQTVFSIAENSKLKFTKPSKCALVANNDLTFGLSRVFLSCREDSNCEVNVFRDLDQAKEWLRQG